jgi:PAS domain S-box-containing protein
LPTSEQVLDQVALAVIGTDPDGLVATWNARAEALHGFTHNEAVGRHISELTVPTEEHRNAAEMIATVRGGAPWQGTLRLCRKDGSRFTAFLKFAPIVEDGRGVIGIVGVAIEIADPQLADAVRTLVKDGNHTGPVRRARMLSPREREVLAMLARGLNGEQIAERLVLSPETVRTHIRNAREKLGASTRVEAVTMALIGRQIDV